MMFFKKCNVRHEIANLSVQRAAMQLVLDVTEKDQNHMLNNKIHDIHIIIVLKFIYIIGCK